MFEKLLVYQHDQMQYNSIGCIFKQDEEKISTQSFRDGPIGTTDLQRITKYLTNSPLKEKIEIVNKITMGCLVTRSDLSILELKGSLDHSALNLLDNVTDIPGHAKYPLLVNGDGNCLPRCGSLLAYGSMEYHADIRLRMAIELIQHKDQYMSTEYLQRGLPVGHQPATASRYAQFSDMYIPGQQLTTAIISNIYDNEVNSILQKGSHCGIWQLFALSSLLSCSIFSVYPQMGYPGVRRDLHRVILPRERNTTSETCFIMWTSLRNDMVRKNWIPNHFVVLLPLEVME